MAIIAQFRVFFGVGLFAAVVHYGALFGLVEWGHWPPVRATLIGYLAGGLVSYLLNRRHTFSSERPHVEAAWRFGLVAGVGFGLTWALMSVFVDIIGAPYFPAQFGTTLIVLFWSFAANKLWTFR